MPRLPRYVAPIAMKNLSSAPAQVHPTSPLPVETPSEHWLLQMNQALMQCQQSQASSRSVLEALLAQVGQLLSASACALLSIDSRGMLLQGIRWQSAGVDQMPQDWDILLQLLQHPLLPSSSNEGKPVAISLQEWLGQKGEPQVGIPTAEPVFLNLTQTIGKVSGEGNCSTERQDSLASFQSALIAPVQFQGATNGLLVVLCSYPRNWLDTETVLVQVASQHIAIAISQMQLQEQVERQRHHQALLTQLTEAIREGVSLEQVYAIAMTGLVTLFQVTQGVALSFKYANPQVKGRTVASHSSVRATLEYAYSQNPEGLMSLAFQQAFPTSSNHRYTFQISDCAVGQAILKLSDAPLLIPSQENSGLLPFTTNHLEGELILDGAFQPASAPLFNFSTLPSLLVVPLTHQGIGLGCLILQHQALRYWQADEVELVQRIAAHLSSALMQANTLRRVQALVEERTAQLRHSMDVQTKLYESSRQQVEQLKQMNQVMEELLSTVSHELLTPLTSMKMAIKMLREAPLNDEQRDRYLHILEHQCSQETRLIRDVLTLRTIESHATALHLHRVDMHAFLLELHNIWQDTLSECDLTLSPKLPERSVSLQTDPESLHRILTELLTNAKKYSAPGHSIDMQLDVESGQKTPHVMLTIQNTGLGIFPEELPVVFDKFRRGQQALQRTIPGIGLGLTLAQGLTSHLNGKIVATSTPIAETEDWLTCFTLTLPLVPEFAH